MASIDNRNRNEKCMVVVNVRRGHNLHDKKIIEGPKIYVRIDIDGQVQKTAFAKDYTIPEWNEELKFELSHFPKLINIDVKDDRVLLPNVRLGHYTYNIDSSQIGNQLQSSLSPFKLIDGTIALMDCESGSLDLSIMISPWGIGGMQQHQQLNTGTLNDINNIKEMCVTIIEATGFKESDLFTRTEPYVEIIFGNKREKTKTRNENRRDHAGHNNKTYWNEQFVFPFNYSNLQHEQNDILFTLKDDDFFKDDNMGRCRIKYSDLMNYLLLSIQNRCDNEYTLPLLFKNNEQNGILRIKLRANDSGAFSGNSNNYQTGTSKMEQRHMYEQQQQPSYESTKPMMNEHEQLKYHNYHGMDYSRQ